MSELRISDGGRHLVRSDGRPFFYLGDTAWELFHRLDRQEVTAYLSQRALQGFTVIQAVVLGELDGLTVPNAYGDLPFHDLDPQQPGEAYFRHVDWVLQEARDRGLVLGLLPTWGRYWKSDGRGPQVFSPQNAFAYGLWLGRRYRDASLIWILGGDQNITDVRDRKVIEAMARGLREGDGGTHLISFHPRGPGNSAEFLPEADWLDFHMVQSSHAAADHDNGLSIEANAAMVPGKPTLDGEPRYETMPKGFYNRDQSRLDRFEAFDVRQAAYWALLAGACGHTYGHNAVWQMWAPGREPQLWADSSWMEALNHAGAWQMGLVRRLFEGLAWENLVPNQAMVLDGPRWGGAKVRAASARDGAFALVYSPFGEPFTVDRRVIRGERIRESWFDPRYGTCHPIHSGFGGSFQTYVPPTSGRGYDWVLILEAGAGP